MASISRDYSVEVLGYSVWPLGFRKRKNLAMRQGQKLDWQFYLDRVRCFICLDNKDIRLAAMRIGAPINRNEWTDGAVVD